MVLTRVAADADQDTLLESLLAIDENRALFGISGAARLLSGVAFFIAAWFLLRTWIIRDRWATPAVPYLFAVSGVCTVLSGAAAIFIAAYSVPETTIINGNQDREIAPTAEFLSGLRWITGKIGFTAAGLAVIVAARYQWQVGGTLRRIAPASLIIGVTMQFIWIHATTILHPIVGTPFSSGCWRSEQCWRQAGSNGTLSHGTAPAPSDYSLSVVRDSKNKRRGTWLLRKKAKAESMPHE